MNNSQNNESVLASLRTRQQIRNYQQQEEPLSNNPDLNVPLIQNERQEHTQNAPENVNDDYREPIPQVVQNLREDDLNLNSRWDNNYQQNQEIDDRGQDAIKVNRTQIIYLMTSIIYIFVSIGLLKSANELEPPMVDGKPMTRCDLDSNNKLKNFAIWTLTPTLLVRISSHLKYRNRDPLDMHERASKYIDGFFHGSYGMWTICNLITYMFVKQSCKEMLSFSILNYQLAILMGCFSASITLFYAIILMIIMPCVCFILYQEHQRNQIQGQRVKKVLKCLVIKDFDPKIFNLHHECSICLSNFEPDEKVVPLPCNKLHLFHQDCIQQWINHQDSCPLCKNTITQEDCNKLRRNFDQIYPKMD